MLKLNKRITNTTNNPMIMKNFNLNTSGTPGVSKIPNFYLGSSPSYSFENGKLGKEKKVNIDNMNVDREAAFSKDGQVLPKKVNSGIDKKSDE